MIAKYLALVVIVLTIFTRIDHTNSVKAETNSWSSSGATLEILRDSITEDSRTPRTCLPATWQYPSYTNTQNRPSSTYRILTANVCEVGNIGSGYVHVGYAYKVKQGVGISGLPNSSKVLLNLNTSNGTQFALGSSWASIGKFTAANTNNLVPEYEINKPLNYFKNDQNQPLSFNYNSWNVSSNGEYIVAEIPYVGLVKIATETNEITLFSTQWFNYGQGYDPIPFLAISNDGQTAAMSTLNGELYTYDLSGCTQKQIKAYNNTATGCSAPKDLKPLIKSQLSNFTRAYYIKFAENNKQMYAVANDYNPTTQVRKNKKIVINSPGYTLQKPAYIAMGDSFASGEGDLSRSYEQDTDTEDNKCHLSTKSYPYQLNQLLVNGDFHSVACSGAKINNIVGSKIVTDEAGELVEQGAQYKNSIQRNWLPGWRAQKSYISSPPSYITLSIGGNNVGFSNKLISCVTIDYKNIPTPDTCKYANDPKAKAGVAKEIANQYKELKTTYQELEEKTGGQTKIYVMGYPQFVEPEGDRCLKNVLLNNEERQFIYKSIHYMNQVIRAAATDSGLKYIDIEDVLVGKNLCGGNDITQIAVNGFTLGPDKEVELNGWQRTVLGSMPATSTGLVLVDRLGIDNGSYHPNQQAQPLIRDRILRETNNSPADYSMCPDLQDRKVCPINLSGKIPQPDSGYFGSEATRYVNMKNGDDQSVVSAPPVLKRIIQGDSTKNSARVYLEGLLPNSSVALEKHSTPTTIGTYYANASGVLDTIVDLTTDQGVGSHEIHAFTTNFAGEQEEYYQHVFITGPEGDINGNNVPDDQEKCGFVPDAGQDIDQDGIDDACDGQISEPPAPEEKETPPSALPTIDNPPSDQKQGLNESVAGWGDEIPLSEQVATSLISTSQGTNSQTSSGASSNQTSSTTSQSDKPIEFNDPRTSSNIANNFNTPQAKGTKSTKIVVPTKPNWFVLIIPLSIILLVTGIFAILRARR